MILGCRSLLAVVAVTLAVTSSPGWAAAGGQQLWVNGYDGPAGLDDTPAAMVVDPTSGNVYVTGSSIGAATGYDYATVAYSSAGVRLWDARYDGAAGLSDLPTGVAVDPATGSVYVTGSSYAIGTGNDYATVAYGPTGAQLWVARYDGASSEDRAAAVAVDPTTGRVYVTGRSTIGPAGADFATVAYGPKGVQLRVTRYDGPAGAEDRATAITVNAGTGTIYVAGESTGLTGTLDYATVAYNRVGRRRWTARYDGTGGGDDFVRGLAVDPGTGTVYVTGSSPGAATVSDYATVGYDGAGAQLWANRYSSGEPAAYDSASALAVDPGGGNVYVTGVSVGAATGFDYATVAYSSAGAGRWVNRYNGPADGDDSAYAVAVDPGSGDVYVTGDSAGRHPHDFATIGYAASGSPLWTARFVNPGLRAVGAIALAVDPAAGHAYVAGTGAGGPLTRLNYTIVAYPTG